MAEKETQSQTKAPSARTIPELRTGMTVRVHQKIKEKNSKGEEKERIQVFEGIILKKRHGNEIGNTITVRKVSDGIGVEKIFPLNSPVISKIEITKIAKVKRANIGYVRNYQKRLKEKTLAKSN